MEWDEAIRQAKTFLTSVIEQAERRAFVAGMNAGIEKCAKLCPEFANTIRGRAYNDQPEMAQGTEAQSASAQSDAQGKEAHGDAWYFDGDKDAGC